MPLPIQEIIMKLSQSDLTKAVQRFARKHGYYARTVRGMTRLRLAAIQEWLSK